MPGWIEARTACLADRRIDPERQTYPKGGDNVETRFDSTLGNGGSVGTLTPAPAPSSQPTRSVIQQAQEQVGQVAGQARQQITSQLDGQRERAAERLEGIAEALHDTGHQLRDRGQAPVGDFAESAARQIEHMTRYMRDKSVDQVVEDVEQFARRNPGLFLAGAFGLGFLAARFLKSSHRNDSGFQMLADAPPAPASSFTPEMPRAE